MLGLRRNKVFHRVSFRNYEQVCRGGGGADISEGQMLHCKDPMESNSLQRTQQQRSMLHIYRIYPHDVYLYMCCQVWRSVFELCVYM